MNLQSYEVSVNDSERENNFRIPHTEQLSNIFQQNKRGNNHERKPFMSFRTSPENSPKSPKKKPKIVFDEKNEKYVPQASHIFKRSQKFSKVNLEEKLHLIEMEGEERKEEREANRVNCQSPLEINNFSYEEAFLSNATFTKKISLREITDVDKLKQNDVIQEALNKLKEGTRFRVPDDKFNIKHIKLIEDLAFNDTEKNEVSNKANIERQKSRSKQHEAKRQRKISKSSFLLNPIHRFLAKMRKKAALNNKSFKANLKYKGEQAFPIIHPNSRLKLLIDTVIFIDLMFQFLAIPIELGFDVNVLDYLCETHPLGFVYIQIIETLLILANIVMKFFTGYFKYGFIVMNSKLIIVHYLKKEFIYDVVAVFPILADKALYLFNVRLIIEFHVVKLLFAFKYSDIVKIFKNLEELLVSHSTQEILIMGCALFCQTFYIYHIFACIWHAIAYYSPGLTTWLQLTKMISNNSKNKYFYSLYWGFKLNAFQGSNLDVPSNTLESLVGVVFMFINIVIWAYIFKRVHLMLDDIHKGENKLKEYLREVNTYMQKKSLDYFLQVKVRKYLNFSLGRENFEDNKSEEHLLSKLAQPIREELVMNLNGNYLKDLKFFSKNFSVDFQNSIIWKIMEQVSFPSQKEIYEQGDDKTERKLYIITQGEVEILIKTEKKNQRNNIIERVSAGSTLGLQSFVSDSPNTYSARALTPVTALVIKRRDFLSIIKSFPEDFEKFCMIKEKILLSQNCEDLYIMCPVCKETNHVLSNCHRVQFVPKREKIIQRFTFSRAQNRRPFARDKKGLSKKFSATNQTVDSFRTKALIFAISNQFNAPVGSPSFEKLDELLTNKTANLTMPKKRIPRSKSGNLLDESYKETERAEEPYSLEKLKLEMSSEFKKKPSMTSKSARISYNSKMLKKSKSLGYQKRVNTTHSYSNDLNHREANDEEEEVDLNGRSKSPTRKSRFFPDSMSSIRLEESSHETKKGQKKRDILKLISQLSRLSKISKESVSTSLLGSKPKTHGDQNLFERGFDKMRNFVSLFPHNNYEVVLMRLSQLKRKIMERNNPFKFLLPVHWAPGSPTIKTNKHKLGSSNNERNDSQTRKSVFKKFIESSFNSLMAKFHPKRNENKSK